MQAIADAGQHESIKNDALLRYVVNIAKQALGRPFPLLGDILRIRDLTKLYADGEIDGLVVACFLPALKKADGKTLAGCTLQVLIRQNGRLEVSGGDPTFRSLAKTVITTLDPKTGTPSQRLQFIVSNFDGADDWKMSTPGEIHQAIDKSNNLLQIDYFMPDTFGSHIADFTYENEFVTKTLQSLTAAQKERFNKALDLVSIEANYLYRQALERVHTEDVFRALLWATKRQSDAPGQ